MTERTAARNPVRRVWITETALSTGLNTSYMAEKLSIFGIVVGVALLLSGVGFLILALGGALRGRSTVALPKVGHRAEVVPAQRGKPKAKRGISRPRSSPGIPTDPIFDRLRSQW